MQTQTHKRTHAHMHTCTHAHVHTCTRAYTNNIHEQEHVQSQPSMKAHTGVNKKCVKRRTLIHARTHADTRKHARM